MVSRNSGSWVLGVQAATTTRLSCCSLMILVRFTWVSWEQVKRLSSTCTTLGRVRAYSRSSGTLMMPPMLMPQLQTKTPMRGGSSGRTSTSGGASRVLVRVQRHVAQGGAHRPRRGRGLHDRFGNVLGALHGAADIDPGPGGGHRRRRPGGDEVVLIQVHLHRPGQPLGGLAHLHGHRQDHQIELFGVLDPAFIGVADGQVVACRPGRWCGSGSG